jgi:DNA repair protein RadA/Sms
MKNRFGPTDEIALFQMSQNGLEEVSNPSQLFLQTRTLGASGSVIIPTIEGSRPMLIEAQALVTDSFYSTPSRRSTGIDPNRLQLLLAVCEKRCQLRLGQSDVFASVTGGMKISEPAADLGLILAIYSSFSNKPFNPNTLVIGEVGLAGEVRAVQRIESRVKEGLQLGFTRCLVPKHNLTGLTRSIGTSIDLRAIEWVDEALEEV